MSNKDQLKWGIDNAIKGIERGVKSYIYDNDNSAYLDVAIQLRKLLIPEKSKKNKLLKHKKSNKCILELCYGRVFLQGFMIESPPTPHKSHSPAISPNVKGLLYLAIQNNNLLPLQDWLKVAICYSLKTGEILKTDRIIKLIADKEAAHIDLNEVIRNHHCRIALSVEKIDIQSDDFNKIFKNYDPWNQFIISAGMRVLECKDNKGQPLFNHSIKVDKSVSRNFKMYVYFAIPKDNNINDYEIVGYTHNGSPNFNNKKP